MREDSSGRVSYLLVSMRGGKNQGGVLEDYDFTLDFATLQGYVRLRGFGTGELL